ncbi:MAG TPA: TraR/DksA C4-type zinc finger protein [Chitinophagaceae bacterium]|nr:TraR/DksA C4-type zinc finger protein [Chitinophagaceae bacterium]
MATKKNARPSGSKTAKPVKKAAKAPVKKSAPVKKAAPAKPVKKAAAKPAPKAKVVAKPAAKKVAAPAKKAPVPAKKAAVPVKKAPVVAKKPEPKKAAPAPAPAPAPKPAAKVTGKPVAKPVPAPAPVKVAPKPVVQVVEVKPPMPKPKPKEVKPPKPVVMPKINATTSRKYEPDFTKSILDQPSPIINGPSMRYSDAELQEFRELIAKKLEAAKKELTYLHGLITRKDEMSGDETDNRYMTMEDGSLSMEREQLSQMASRQIDFIDKLEKALVRIENKTYGICRVTGKLIDKARLRAVPHATLSIEAKMGMAKNPNIQ